MSGRLALAIVVGLAAGSISASASEHAGIEGTIAYDFGDHLAVSDLGGTDRRLVVRTPRGPRSAAPPVWSPDGRSVALVRGGDVYVGDIGGRVVTRVARLPGHSLSPRWSPDGRRLAFGWLASDWCRAGAQVGALYVAEARTNGVYRLTSVEPRGSSRHALAFDAVAWSPDGRRLLYGEDRWRVPGCGLLLGDNLVRSTLLHVGVAGGRPTPIPAASAGPADWSPDGRSILHCGGHVGISRRDGRVIRSWPAVWNQGLGCTPGHWNWLLWSRDGDDVYAAVDDRVVALPVRDGRPRTLFQAKFGCRGDFTCSTSIQALSSDGRWLVIEAEGGKSETRALVAIDTETGVQRRLPHPGDVPFSVFVR